MVDSSSAEAVLFFDDHEIIKEMTYAEFQAILDNYVPMQDIANRAMEAVYVRINRDLCVTAAVFFRIPFDRQGFVEKKWNIPLQHLADNAAKGPNLGAGPIALACYSQCPIEWHQKNLWDPVMQASHNDFVSIKKAIKNNSLGIVFNVTSKNTEGHDSHFDEERTRAAILIREQRLRQRLLVSKAEQEMRQMSLDHQQRLLAYQQQINEYQQQLNQQQNLNLELKETIAGQADKIAGIREYFENKLKLAEEAETSELETLREQYESELMLRIESASADYEAELRSKDVEILYRSERESQLQQEIVKLQRENQRLLSSTGDNLLGRLSDAGVTFVIYHPGAGHLTLNSGEICAYLDNPTAFAARHCGVNEQLYSLWLDHFYSPTCQQEVNGDELCDEPILRLDDPSQFIIGESDRCTHHRTKVPSVVNINKHGRPTIVSAKT